MPFSDQSGLVSMVLKYLGESHLATIKPVPVTVKTVLVAVFSGKYAGATWATDSIGYKAVTKKHAFLCKSINIWRFVDARAISANGVRRMVVSEYENNIRLPGLCTGVYRGCGDYSHQAGEQKPGCYPWTNGR